MASVALLPQSVSALSSSGAAATTPSSPSSSAASSTAVADVLRRACSPATGDGSSRHRPAVSRRTLLGLAAVDLLSGVCITFGLLSVGGGTYVVIYSSVTAWTALLSWVVLRKPLSKRQVSAVALLCAGLALNTFSHAAPEDADTHAAGNHAEHSAASSLQFAVGVVVLLAGSVLHSLMFVLSELLLQRAGPAYSSWTLCAEMGRIEAVALVCWNVLLVVTSSVDAPASGVWEWLPLLALTACNAVHAASFFLLLGALGSVSSAMMKGAQMVAVWIVAAALFCDKEHSQCFTPPKAASVAVVVVALVAYAKAPGGTARTKAVSSPPPAPTAGTVGHC